MDNLKKIWIVAATNFRRWRRNPQIIMSFVLGFMVCFLLTDKVVVFAEARRTILQMFEPFIWTFGDAKSILIISLILLILFSDMPNLNNDVPFFLIRINRKIWLLGQLLYMVLTTLIFLTFILMSTCVLAASKGYPGNVWSDTAAVLGYSSLGEKIAVPAFVKVLELSFPYQCTLHIFGLMLGYSVLLGCIMLFLNLCRGQAGMVGGIIFSVFGLLMTRDVIGELLHIPNGQLYRANILFGWISPLNNATYYMHNFGYDNLPRLWMSYSFFAIGIAVFSLLSLWKIKKYQFSFTGTER